MNRVSARIAMTAGLAALSCVALAPAEAFGGIVIKGTTVMGGGTGNPIDPIVTFRVIVTPGTEIQKGDFFTVYDVSKAKPTDTGEPDNWIFVTLKRGPTPDGVNPTDNKKIYNVSWFYTVQTFDNTTGKNVLIGDFSFNTTDNVTNGQKFIYAQQSHDLSGTIHTNTGKTVVGPAIVPEPATLILAGTAAPLVWLWYRRRRKALGT
jgi:hypothetical protein